jgi:tetratricopeptide (TPR) repeat protein
MFQWRAIAGRVSVRVRLAVEGSEMEPDADPELALMNGKMGDQLARQGDPIGALDYYVKALRIFERASESDPHNIGKQRDVAVILTRVGDLLMSQNDADGALPHHTRALNIRKVAAEFDPDDTGWQHELAVIHNRVGDTLAAGGDADGAKRAMEHYTQSLFIMQRLTEAKPLDTGWQLDLAVGFCHVASVEEALGAPWALRDWTRAHQVLVALDAAGELPDRERGLLEHVASKIQA